MVTKKYKKKRNSNSGGIPMEIDNWRSRSPMSISPYFPQPMSISPVIVPYDSRRNSPIKKIGTKQRKNKTVKTKRIYNRVRSRSRSRSPSPPRRKRSRSRSRSRSPPRRKRSKARN